MAELSVNIENESQSERSEDEQTLDLSCGSSSFDESVTDEVYDPNSIKPFRFEPYESGSNESDSVDSDDHENIDNRLQNTDWCTCGNCISMPTAAESVCCHEVEKIHHLFTDLNSEVHCITAHPGFQPACLNTYVLQIAYYQYKQQYREDIEDSSEKYRYTAYRQLARWAWGYLGRKIRVPLPSCAVNQIKNTFPSESGHYKGFKQAN